MEVKEKIKKMLIDVLEEIKHEGIGGLEGQIKLEHPAEEAHGDYSSNIALRLGGGMELADKIVERLGKESAISELVEKIEVAKPGFINFWLSKKVLEEELENSLKDGYGSNETLRDRKVMVEYTDQNPFKELHIGHLYSNAIGESLCRLFESEGAEVKRVIYQGDIGLHVAKAIWGIKELGGLEAVTGKSLEEKTKFLGEAYALGARLYEEDSVTKEQIIALNKKIYELDPDVKETYEKGREWSLEAFEKIYKRLGTKFDFYYLESEVGEAGLQLVREYLDKGVFVESKGAVIFPGEKYGLHNRVFINSLGLPTYEAKELGLAPRKYKDFPYDESVIVTGNDIKEYFKVLLAALKQIYPELAAKTKHVPHGMVRLPSGKMSSRTGQVITGEWLLDEAKNKLKEAHPEMEDDTADQVAVGAVKCALLKAAIGGDVIFDFDKSLSFEGDSGPYLQYTFARTQSVLSKSTDYSLKTTADWENAVDSSRWTVDPAPEELALLRYLYRFPEVVEDAANNFAPNLVCTYLFELASRFNTFYSRHRILPDEAQRYSKHRILENQLPNQPITQSTQVFRLALTQATGNILKTGLSLLGIKAPGKM